MIKKVVFFMMLIVFLIGFIPTSYGAGIRSVLNTLEKGDVDLAKRLARELTSDERLKLEIILYLMENRNKKAKQLLRRLKGKRRNLFNTLYLEKNRYAIAVSKSRQKLYIVEFFRGFPIIKKNFSITTGEVPGDKWELGDKKTPNGVYFPLYFKTGLPKVYGSGAFPLNYPNSLDKYFFGKTGGGIWIHSSDRKFYISKYSSKGCVISTEPDFQKIKKFVSIKNTPVVITEDIEFIDDKLFKKYQSELLGFYKKWINGLKEFLRTDGIGFYFLYSPNFVSEFGGKFSYIKKNYKPLQKDKNIHIKTYDLAILKYGRIMFYGDIFVISFILEYSSEKRKFKERKVLYIKKEDGRFRILAEENIVL